MIVITGAAGFIGSALIWGLNKQSFDDILVVDELLCDQRWKNLVNLRFSDFVHKDDFVDFLKTGAFGDKIDGIIHMGACSDTTEKNADYLLRNNYEYTKHLAEWCIEEEKRFLYASSGATYGDGSMGFSDDHELIPKLRPLNMYGYSKQLFDKWVLAQNITDRVVGLKYFNVFGPNEYHKGEMRSVVHKTFEQIQQSGKVRLFKSYNPNYKNGWQLRDFIYIKDVVDMTLWAYQHGNVSGIFNIGTGKARSFYDLAVAVFSVMGKPVNIEYVDMPESIRGKYQYFTQAKMEKFRNAGYSEDTTSLEDGIADYVKNYLLTDEPYLGKSEEL